MGNAVKTYQIGVHGCDASTEFEMELTDIEFRVVQRVMERCCEKSSYGCEPTMSIELARKPNDQ